MISLRSYSCARRSQENVPRLTSDEKNKSSPILAVAASIRGSSSPPLSSSWLHQTSAFNPGNNMSPILLRPLPPNKLTPPFSPHSRPVSTESLPPDTSILAEQRLRRPVSPHLTIYQPQITWYASALNRITGSVLSGGFYVFGFTYLVSPLFGWHFLDSAVLASSFGALPWWGKAGLKFGVALPFTFHSFNGVRHLVWDTGRELSNQQVRVTGWAVVGATMLASGVLAGM